MSGCRSTAAENSVLAAKALKTSHARRKVHPSNELMAAPRPRASNAVVARSPTSTRAGSPCWTPAGARQITVDARTSQRVHNHAASNAGRALHAGGFSHGEAGDGRHVRLVGFGRTFQANSLCDRVSLLCLTGKRRGQPTRLSAGAHQRSDTGAAAALASRQALQQFP